uniref:Uncharacterized protein n=1 Tax=Anopheles dirus TaxID=7168 RepID=A0A182NWC9_9DIPT
MIGPASVDGSLTTLGTPVRIFRFFRGGGRRSRLLHGNIIVVIRLLAARHVELITVFRRSESSINYVCPVCGYLPVQALLLTDTLLTIFAFDISISGLGDHRDGEDRYQRNYGNQRAPPRGGCDTSPMFHDHWTRTGAQIRMRCVSTIIATVGRLPIQPPSAPSAQA